MLRGIDPLLTPDLLKVLAEMGHGDAIVLVDANFTAASLGRDKPLLRLPGIGLREACAAVLSVFPLGRPDERPVGFMQVEGSTTDYRSALQREVIDDMVTQGLANDDDCEAVDRFAFYDRVKSAYAIVQTGERQPYANFIFKKGVIGDTLLA